MPQAFAVNTVVDAIGAVVGVGVLFAAVFTLARHRLERGRATPKAPAPVTESRRVPHRKELPVGRRAFRMPPGYAPAVVGPSKVVAIAPMARIARVDELDEPSAGPLAQAHLYDMVSREYITATATMPAIRPAPAAVVTPLPRRQPRFRPDGTPIRPIGPIQYRNEQRQADPPRKTGWFGEGEVCG
jgi:hypothetical protein